MFPIKCRHLTKKNSTPSLAVKSHSRVIHAVNCGRLAVVCDMFATSREFNDHLARHSGLKQGLVQNVKSCSLLVLLGQQLVVTICVNGIPNPQPALALNCTSTDTNTGVSAGVGISAGVSISASASSGFSIRRTLEEFLKNKGPADQ